MDGWTDRRIISEEEVASNHVRGKQKPNCRRPYLQGSSAVNHCQDLEEMLKSFKPKKKKEKEPVYVSERSSRQQAEEGVLGQES